MHNTIQQTLKNASVGGQITALQRQVRELTDCLQDAVMLASKHKSNMGQIDQEELARLDAKANGKVHNSKEWDTTDKNGEQ